MPDETREVRDTDQPGGESVDRKHRARRHAARLAGLDDRHPGAGRSQFRFETQFLYKAQRVTIGAGNELRATLDQVSVARFGTDSSADVIARLEHGHVRSRLS